MSPSSPQFNFVRLNKPFSFKVLKFSITMNSTLKFFVTIFKNIAFTLAGSLVLVFLLISVILNIPIYIYRWTVCKIIAPFFNRKLGKAVNLHGSAIAFELIGKYIKEETRSGIVTSTTYEGSIDFEDFKNLVLERWIHKRNDDGTLKYPELQQYIKGYLGYLFFKTDKHFDINNHVNKHIIDKSSSEADCEKFVCSMSEKILNRRYTPRRSPWQFDLIYNYRNSEILPDGKEMTVILFSWHHSLMDGFSAFNCFFEGLFGISQSQCALPTPTKVQNRAIKSSKFISSIINFVTFPVRVVKDLGFTLYLMAVLPQTPWHIPEDKRSGRMHYCRSGIIPMNKLKTVKDAFGVSFTTVLLAGMSAGISSAFKSKNFETKKIPFGVALPMKGGHSPKLRNQVTATLFEIPVGGGLTPVERLQKAEKYFKIGRESTAACMGHIWMKLLIVHVYPLARILYKNNFFSTSCSNFPGSGVPLICNGHKLLTNDFGCGLLPGKSGAGFMIISYNGHIRIVVTAENKAMERHEVDEMIKQIVDEFESLYEQAISSGERYTSRSSLEFETV